MKLAIINSQEVNIGCLYMKCKNHVFKDSREVRKHIIWKGFVENYYDWRCHYNVFPGESDTLLNKSKDQFSQFQKVL